MLPRLRVRGRLQQHLRLCPYPQRQAGHAVLRVRGHRGKMPTPDECVSTLRLVVFSPHPSLANSPLPVVCGGLRPEGRPPPAGEHREEGGPGRPADDEPAAHQAAVLRGQQLQEHSVKLDK